MNIQKEKNDTALILTVEGHLDALNARELEAELRSSIEGVTLLTFDLKDLEYIASGGIRVLVSAQKVMLRQGSMVLRNVQPQILDLLDVTGLTDVFTIE